MSRFRVPCTFLSLHPEPDQFTQDLIFEHNRYRKEHGSPPLSWNAKAARAAQKWAEHLAEMGKLEHSLEREFGQNLAFYSDGTLTAEKTVEMWYEEISKYHFNRPGFSSSTGNFTQLVWASTTMVGVGRAVNGSSTYVVANYLPPGNVQGRFELNVTPAKE